MIGKAGRRQRRPCRTRSRGNQRSVAP